MPSERFGTACIQLDEISSANQAHFMRSHNSLYFNPPINYEEATSKLYHTDFLSPSLSTVNSASTPHVESNSHSQPDVTPSRLPLNASLIMNFTSSNPEPSFNPCSISSITNLSTDKSESIPTEPLIPQCKRRVIKLERSLKLNRHGLFSCRHCKQSFSQRRALYKHQWMHSRIWPEVQGFDLNSPEQFAMLQAAHVLLDISGSKSLEE